MKSGRRRAGSRSDKIRLKARQFLGGGDGRELFASCSITPRRIGSTDMTNSVFEHYLRRFREYQRISAADVPKYILDTVKMIGFIPDALSEEERHRYFRAG